MDQHNERIAAAVATCLRYAAAAKNPLDSAADLSPLLKGAGWAESDIGQIQERVQASLMHRRATDVNADSTAGCAARSIDLASLPPGGIERRRGRSSPAI